MKSLIYHLYRHGNTGLSNLIMSVEVGVVLAHLTDRVLVLKGNVTPPANVVQYDGILDNRNPSRVTDLIDLGVPWIDVEDFDLASVAPHELCPHAAWEAVVCFPDNLSTRTEDFAAFARRRRHVVTVGDDLQHVPALSFSGGDEVHTLCFYSYQFYLDRAAQMQALDALRRIRPKRPMAELAQRICDDLGTFNAVHIRRGDFKKTFGVTTLDRTPAEALATMDAVFSRDDLLVIVTDEAQDPFFKEITAAYHNHVFLDHHILETSRAEFMALPAHDSIALAFLSQLVASRSQEFIGTMTSTFTSMIQRMRGNTGRQEHFRFLWNELPDRGAKLDRGSHAKSDCIELVDGIMVEDQEGPYTWNRHAQHLNPAWMREWPESILDEAAMITRARGRPLAKAAASQPSPHRSGATSGGTETCKIAFLDTQVVFESDDVRLCRSLARLFKELAPKVAAEPIARIRLDTAEESSELRVNGKAIEKRLPKAQRAKRIYREVVKAFIKRHSDLVWLHAGSVAAGGVALVLPGAWGRGKSSLSLDLYRRGWTFLSDDIAPVDTQSKSVLPFPGTPQVRKRICEELPRDRLGEISKSAVPLDPSRIARDRRKIRTFVFPRYRKGAALALTELSPGQAVGELLENCLSVAENEDATIERLCRLVEGVSAYRLDYDDTGDAADLLEQAHRNSGFAVPARRDEVSTADREDAGGSKESDMSNDVRMVDVEVALVGNQTCSTRLAADAPALRDLHTALALNADPAARPPATLIQLPMNGGRTAHSFMSTSVVALKTTPPVIVELQAPVEVQEPAHAAQPLSAGVLPFVRIDDFLTPGENDELLKYAIGSEDDFKASSVTSGDAGYRQSKVHFGIKDTKWKGVILDRLELHLPHILATLGVTEFNTETREIQLTASNDGDFFKAHADAAADDGDTEARMLTFVYYLNRTPRAYSGGNIIFWDGNPTHTIDTPVKALSVAPENNCLIAFTSSQMHEVDMVKCPSQEFADSRFTVNGWYRRAR